MLVLLPRQADGLAAVEKSLSAARIGQVRAKLQPEANVEAYPAEVQAAHVVRAECARWRPWG
jgi:hypothetical protein